MADREKERKEFKREFVDTYIKLKADRNQYDERLQLLSAEIHDNTPHLMIQEAERKMARALPPAPEPITETIIDTEEGALDASLESRKT